jgi:hypothetical protein
MNFDTGLALAQSERYNTCDSLWTHEYELSFLYSDGTWSPDWDNWQCWANTSTNPAAAAWFLHKNSASDLNVTQSFPGSIC